ncbi:polysaccharide deacetylase family sporulation protein PdaB [Aquibacillus koreensis]|uniref:Polysaccharide deacetylase family sporulation protein PdaB n=1 Tax=Aquibacillus koreensis TaxID=279446 RepID=A0A9X3WP45_9BACI|nr:polysaccharide deacetylase family sporulation protein PdaB [Aquibacillus koreensis]MCT2536562.1 polysaccharide deacetylase family sporulation protein PdaB [Aquibacillus koreensis]MDC3422490.1 polysaccharide deacetylase family sporulation protein PdaB [Aquibacillus koreensis]
MQHFFVFNMKRRRKSTLIVLAALFTAIFLWVETESSFSVFSSKENPVALSKGSEEDSNISLTFNITWGNEMVEPILEKLKQHDVQATFFISGEWAERHPELVKKIEENKHEIGMMGYRYKSYIQQEKEQIRKDLAKANEIFGKLGYSDTKIFRTPSGQFNNEVLSLLEQRGYEVIHWSVNPEDWRNPGEQLIIDRVMKQTSNGDIILLHASDSVKQTHKALDTILPGLKNKGFTFVNISEMISRAHSESDEVD